MANCNQLPMLLPTSVIQRASKLNTTLLSDALNGNSMEAQIKPVSTEMKVVGTAMTVSMRPTDNLFLHKAIYSGQEGYVLVADGKGSITNAYLGELMIRAAKAVGLEGVVIDGAIRDKVALEQLNYPVFSKGFVPNGPLKDGPGHLHTAIVCGGALVSPGDLVVGDADGVTVVPKNQIEKALKKAEEKLEYEEKRIEAIEQYEKQKKLGKVPDSIAPDWLDEKLKPYGD